MENKLNKRGGKREGSGRKSTGWIVERSFTARQHDINKLNEIKLLTGENLRDIFARVVDVEYKKICEDLNIQPKEFPLLRHPKKK